MKKLGLVLAAVWMAGCAKTDTTAKAAGGAGAAPSATVRVAAASLRTMPVEIRTIGKVESVASVEVKSLIAGTVMKARFTEGDFVKAGDVLFEMDSRPYEEAVRQWEANLARDQALQKQGEAQLASAQAQENFYGMQAARYEKLAAQGLVAQEQSDQANVEARARRTNVRAVQASIDSVKATIRADEAALANARLNLSYCKVTAPISGRTGDMRVKPGNVIKANEPEARLLTLRERMKRGGVAVSAAIPDDPAPASQGTLRFLDNAVDEKTGTIRLKASFANAETRLWPGQFVHVRVLLEQLENAVVIPAAALQNSQAGNFVYVVGAEEKVEMRPVTVGTRADREVSIEKGLRGGERVVVEGQLRLAPGMKVRVAG